MLAIKMQIQEIWIIKKWKKNKKVKEQEIQKEVQKEDRSKEIYPYAGEKPQHRDLDADVRNELHRSSRSR